MNFDKKKWVTVREAAKILDVTPYIINRLCLDCDLTRININVKGKRATYLITMESIRELQEKYPHLIAPKR